MINFDRVAERILGIIKGNHHQPKMYTAGGKETAKPTEARWFFVKEPNYMVALDETAFEIKFNRSKELELSLASGLLSSLKDLGRDYMLKTTLKVFGERIKPKDYANDAQDVDSAEEVIESAMFGSNKTSYQAFESVKIVVKHRKSVDENVRGARSRAIKNIFIECDGERTEFPSNDLIAARAMARHYTKGGLMEDTVGQHILKLANESAKLKEFVVTTRRSKLVNEDNENLIEMAREEYGRLRESLRKFVGAKTYDRVAENVSQVIDEDEEQVDEELADLFTVRKLDDSVKAALPVVNRLVNERKAYLKRIEEASASPITLSREVELTEDEVLEYEDPKVGLGHRLGHVSRRIEENEELASFLSNLSEKLIEGSELDTFESTVLRNVLENITT